jgi:membrane associated rhomboid family serine protease
VGCGVQNLSKAGALWCLVALMLALPAAWAGHVSLADPTTTWPAWAQSWVLHPDLGWYQDPWVWWSTAWLHGSAQHLSRNLIATTLIGLLGCTPGMRAWAALAWLLAWPLTHIGMRLQPIELHTYIGLSGVLHAGIVIWCIDQITQKNTDGFKWVASIVLMAVVLKIFMENPWQHALIQPAGSDITVAPWAHFSGALSGLVLALLARGAAHLLSAHQLSSARRTLI